MNLHRFLPLAAIAFWLAWPADAAETAAAKHWPTMEPARHVSNAAAAPLLASARAGNRVVAVGDHGVILLSDDGVKFRQAKMVPVRSLLTSVQFLDARRGYAAGHDGVVLGTQDGGETWILLRAEPGVEQPILSMHFDSLEHGIAVGLYGWAIETRDAGRTWSGLDVEAGENADRHLLHMFASSRGSLFIVGEGGTIYRSTDRGKSWEGTTTGDKGSLWYGLVLSDGTLLACGMRGHVYRSSDDGKTWQSVEAHTSQSLTGIAQLADGSVIVVGMAGTVLESRDHGKTFTFTERVEQEALTAVLPDGSRPLLLSMTGPLPGAGPAR
ncbi:WD40/YVTN/BNR-like repeat-containing protein [Cupriavidus sp. IDO]|uniref:WD40/YVTN/BNR-like repeat-containing protein n=1 Tax=Cupriavidus sp. IDO TaxID=1539142 RepID=UPI00068E4B94|nr:YCF48-related protein [Cupriavidus sp. IDO]KWR75048.1 glycosyl hydrolase [Cupriavidus sp. IDO]